jgi:hypothetical protein
MIDLSYLGDYWGEIITRNITSRQWNFDASLSDRPRPHLLSRLSSVLMSANNSGGTTHIIACSLETLRHSWRVSGWMLLLSHLLLQLWALRGLNPWLLGPKFNTYYYGSQLPIERNTEHVEHTTICLSYCLWKVKTVISYCPALKQSTRKNLLLWAMY